MLGKLDLFKENDTKYISFTKIIKKWVKDLNVRLETLNYWEYFQDTDIGKDFLKELKNEIS